MSTVEFVDSKYAFLDLQLSDLTLDTNRKLIHRSSRTVVYVEDGIVYKEQIVPYDVSAVPNHFDIVSKALQRTLAEINFFSTAFAGFVPETDVETAIGCQNVVTVRTKQQYIPGNPLSKFPVHPRDERLREFWIRCVGVYRDFGRLPDLHSPWRVGVGRFSTSVPYPFATENIILSHDSKPYLVDVEDQMFRWSDRNIQGKIRSEVIHKLIVKLAGLR